MSSIFFKLLLKLALSMLIKSLQLFLA